MATLAGMGEAKTSVVELEKGSAGLGFNIVGGSDKNYIPGDSGIFISSLKADGVAQRDGRLKVGDRIVRVNDVSLVDIPHDSAVATFRAAKGRVHLEVEYEAERRVLEKPSRILVDLPFKPAVPVSKTKSEEKVVITAAPPPDSNAKPQVVELSPEQTAKNIAIVVTPQPEEPLRDVIRRSAAGMGDTVDTPSVSAAVSQSDLHQQIDDIPKTPKNGATPNTSSFFLRPPVLETLATVVGAVAIVAVAIFIYRRQHQD